MDWYLFTVNYEDEEFTGELWKTMGPESQFEGDYQLEHRTWSAATWSECVEYFMQVDGLKLLSNGHMLVIAGENNESKA